MMFIIIVCVILFASTLVGLMVQFHDVIESFTNSMSDKLGSFMQSLPPFFEGFIITAIVMIVILIFIDLLVMDD